MSRKQPPLPWGYRSLWGPAEYLPYEQLAAAVLRRCGLQPTDETSCVPLREEAVALLIEWFVSGNWIADWEGDDFSQYIF